MSRAMMRDYLKEQASTCLRWARETYDLSTARHLREMAEEFSQKADELTSETVAIESGGPEANDGRTDATPTDDA